MQQLGKYEILGVIGEGGMGTVYHARDSVIGRDVAIKVIQERAINIPEVRERFLREAQAAGRLAHENVMVIHDVGEEDGLPFIVMEHLAGTDLRKLLDAHAALSLDDKLFIAIQICEGLQYAHEHRVVHRDVKPDNIRILRGNRVKIMDFGIARLTADVQTLTNTSIGTPRYMSPEQIKGARVDHRSDIFSFGVLFYEMLTGSNPFWGEHVTTVIYKILNEEPQPIQIDDSRLEGDLQAIVSKCLAKDVNERYPDMAPVLRDLRGAIQKRQGATRTQPLPTRLLHDETQLLDPSASTASAATTGSVSAKPRKGYLKPIAAGAGAVAVVALLLIVLLPRTSPEATATPELEETAAAGTLGDAAIEALRADVIAAQRRMEEEKQRAEAASVPRTEGTPFAQGMALEESGLAALARNDESGLQEAHEAFGQAADLFSESTLAAAGSDESALRAQAEQAQRAMRQAQSRVSDAGIRRAFPGEIAAADRASTSAEDLMSRNEYADAVRAFREAETAYTAVRRANERESAARETAIQAQARMQGVIEAASAAPVSTAQSDLVRQADAARAQGDRQLAAGEWARAATSFESARGIYVRAAEVHAAAATSALAARRGQAERAREVMLAALGSVVDARRDHDDYRRAESLQAEGDDAFASGAFDQAQQRFEEAARLFAELGREAAAPAGPAPEVVAEQTVNRLVSRLKAGFEAKDLAALTAISPEFGSWRDFFAVASGITADISSSDFRVAGARATVLMHIQLDYRDNKNRRQSTPTLRQDWTLERSGDDWRVVRVAARN